MAAHDNTSMNESQMWSYWANANGLKVIDIEQETQPNNEHEVTNSFSGKQNVVYKKKFTSNCSKLPQEDMTVYGILPLYDEFIIAVCEQCKLHVKQECLIHHIELRHPVTNIKKESTWEESQAATVLTTSPSYTSSQSANKKTSKQQQQGSESSVHNSHTSSGALTVTNNSSSSTVKSENSKPPGKSRKNHVVTAFKVDTIRSFSKPIEDSFPKIKAKLPSPQQPPPPVGKDCDFITGEHFLIREFEQSIPSSKKSSTSSKSSNKKMKISQKKKDVGSKEIGCSSIDYCCAVKETEKSRDHKKSSQRTGGQVQEKSFDGQLNKKRDLTLNEFNPLLVSSTLHFPTTNSVNTSSSNYEPDRISSPCRISHEDEKSYEKSYSSKNSPVSNSKRSKASGHKSNQRASKKSKLQTIVAAQNNSVLSPEVSRPIHPPDTSFYVNNIIATPNTIASTNSECFDGGVERRETSEIPSSRYCLPDIQEPTAKLLGCLQLSQIPNDSISSSIESLQKVDHSLLPRRHCPKPTAICSFGLRQIDEGVFVTDPDYEHIRSAFKLAAKRLKSRVQSQLTVPKTCENLLLSSSSDLNKPSILASTVCSENVVSNAASWSVNPHVKLLSQHQSVPITRAPSRSGQQPKKTVRNKKSNIQNGTNPMNQPAFATYSAFDVPLQLSATIRPNSSNQFDGSVHGSDQSANAHGYPFCNDVINLTFNSSQPFQNSEDSLSNILQADASRSFALGINSSHSVPLLCNGVGQHCLSPECNSISGTTSNSSPPWKSSNASPGTHLSQSAATEHNERDSRVVSFHGASHSTFQLSLPLTRFEQEDASDSDKEPYQPLFKSSSTKPKLSRLLPKTESHHLLTPHGLQLTAEMVLKNGLSTNKEASSLTFH